LHFGRNIFALVFLPLFLFTRHPHWCLVVHRMPISISNKTPSPPNHPYIFFANPFLPFFVPSSAPACARSRGPSGCRGRPSCGSSPKQGSIGRLKNTKWGGSPEPSPPPSSAEGGGVAGPPPLPPTLPIEPCAQTPSPLLLHLAQWAWRPGPGGMRIQRMYRRNSAQS